MYITASSTISHQLTFRNKGFSSQLSELNTASELLSPDYSLFIPPMERRRMSDVLKMAITCSIDCMEQTGLLQPDAIIVGTSMGCCTNTKNFLDKILDADGKILSPTSFILSTHNTIAGQISLILKNHGYNMTHTQNTLSFEQALIDGMICLEGGLKNVLVGATDEIEPEMYNVNARLNLNDVNTTKGASFYMLTSQKTDTSVQIVDVGSFGLINNISNTINEFLESNNYKIQDINLCLFSKSNDKTKVELENIFDIEKLIDFQVFSGVYFTNPGFALHYGLDILTTKNHPQLGKSINTILICNNLIPENLGLILIHL